MPGALPCFLAPPLLPILAAGMDEMAEYSVGLVAAQYGAT